MTSRQKCLVVKNERAAPGHYILTLRGPGISKNSRPGQFVQIKCAASQRLVRLRRKADPLLPRPFSFLTAGKSDFSILYQVVGKGTELLARKKKGDEVWVVGPLGNGFNAGKREEVRGERKSKKVMLLVGGGVGIPPLYHLAEAFLKQKIKKENIHVFLGARNKSLLLCEKDFNRLGVNLHLATDDGSKGEKGLITEALEDFLISSRQATRDPRQIYACGPTPMLKAVSQVAAKYKVPCEVSVEEPMACGFGACLGCAIKVKDRGDRRQDTGYNRFAIACTEGPVFNSEDIVW